MYLLKCPSTKGKHENWYNNKVKVQLSSYITNLKFIYYFKICQQKTLQFE